MTSEDDFLPRPDSSEIHGLTPHELDIFYHEIRKPLTLTRGFCKMANTPSISGGEKIEEIDEMLAITTGVSNFIERILTTDQRQLVQVLSQGSEAPLVKGIVKDTLFPEEIQKEERKLWFGKIDDPRLHRWGGVVRIYGGQGLTGYCCIER